MKLKGMKKGPWKLGGTAPVYHTDYDVDIDVFNLLSNLS